MNSTQKHKGLQLFCRLMAGISLGAGVVIWLLSFN